MTQHPDIPNPVATGIRAPARLLTANVPGAPIRIGQHVTVTKAIDETCLADQIGCSGVVVHLEYSCGCGQTYPADPMIGVQLDDGRTDEFWLEELDCPKEECDDLATRTR